MEIRRLAIAPTFDTSARPSSSEIDPYLLAKISSKIGSFQVFFEYGA